MAGTKILVLGGTGPAGICLLRELLYRKHEIIVYARTPSKIPSDLADNPLLEIIQGTLTDHTYLSTAVSHSSSIISLLGPNILDRNFDPSIYATFYSNVLFPVMRTHSVRRILAMGTTSISRPEDKFSLVVSALLVILPVFFSTAYKCITLVGGVFEKEVGGEIDWTVFRIAGIPGGCDEESWWKDRGGERGGKGDFVGWVGEKGWAMNQKRGALARWLVDAVEGGADQWIGKMPLVAAGTLG